MPIISDEQICLEGDKENEDIYANIMQNSDCQGKISVWKMEFDSEEHAHQWYNEYANEVGFSIRKQWKNEDRFSGVISNNSGIPPKLAHELMSHQVGGRENLGFTKQDHKNYLRTKRKSDLQQGEVGGLLNYFLSQVSENPSFFFRVQLDVEDQITNIFWADAKMIFDYGIYGDVVFFDTTYRTNKECRPFGAFVGVNHHYH
ncbi:protein FAR1-RELATED SEQUENCE 5-like [Quercus robur]|uniref:protein FAR1-RELATED SEQUENCE 5-like n=1 Tax=Quercus robur TaxID=38942 RepID=UPI0021621E8B|nr:protein FAR1-RELATED SEQUENCE 5-like [Quercus robur]